MDKLFAKCTQDDWDLAFHKLREFEILLSKDKRIIFLDDETLIYA